MRIGFIGLGTMGRPMAANLARAGFHLTVWNRSPGPAAALDDRGASAAASPREAADGAEVLISMLADDDAVRGVVLNGGALDGLKPGAIHVNMATISVAFAAELAGLHGERGVHYVAAPVLGRVDVAEAGQLQIVTAGPGEAIDRAQPLFDVLGARTWRFGDRPERANAVKLAVNFMLACAVDTLGQAVAFIEGHEAEKGDFVDLITSTGFASPIYKGYGAAIVREAFDPAGFKLSLALKDVRLALEAAEAARVPMPIASAVKDDLLDAVAHDEGGLDLAALSRVARRRAGQG